MTTHIPECPMRDRTDSAAVCICDRLRTCEQRVIAAAKQAVSGFNESHLVWEHDVLDALDELKQRYASETR